MPNVPGLVPPWTPQSSPSFNMRIAAVIIGIVAIVWLLKRRLGVTNDLTEHYKEQDALKAIGNVANDASVTARSAFPLATIGNTPYAGLNIDPLNQDNPFAQPRPIDLYQSEIGGQPLGTVIGPDGEPYNPDYAVPAQ